MSASRSPSTSPRGRRRSTRVIDSLTPETAQKTIENLQHELIEKDATILALQSELQRLQNDLQSTTRVVRREHPLQVRAAMPARKYKQFFVSPARISDLILRWWMHYSLCST